MFTSDPNPMALSDVYLLFTTIVYLAIQVACFDAIFDYITNMIGHLFYLHIVKSTPNNQAWKRRGFLIFILALMSHLTFLKIFKRDFTKLSFKHANIILRYVVFLYSLSM